ncbi:MAG TPA: ParB/RepB/Spo0J family partition protein [bacterium]|nr:ParB/RepB/Spo0J family partition protein [bacterium]
MARKALGKGLDALIPDFGRATMGGQATIVDVGIDEIAENPYQPRTRISEASLEDLRQSISEKGVLQPVILRRKAGRYELVAGERRLRAARLANLRTVPAVVRQVSDSEALEIALVENIQREDLNPMDEARGYRELIKRFKLTQEQLGKKLGRDRSTITNSLRLLNLADEIRRGLEESKITVGHARALLGLEDEKQAVSIYRTALHRGLSVRQVEAMVRQRQRPRVARKVDSNQQDPEIGRIEQQLMRKLGTRVRIIGRGGHGKIEIEFYSADDLNRILDAMR